MKTLLHMGCLIGVAMLLSACETTVLGYDTRPEPLWIQTMPKDAPPVYKQGWKDGCESGYSAFGNSAYKSVYYLKKDKSLIHDKVYLQSWGTAFDYCRSKVNRDLIEGLWWGPGPGGSRGEGIFPHMGQTKSDNSYSAGFFDQVLPMSAKGGIGASQDLRDTPTISQQGFMLPMTSGLKMPGEP